MRLMRPKCRGATKSPHITDTGRYIHSNFSIFSVQLSTVYCMSELKLLKFYFKIIAFFEITVENN